MTSWVALMLAATGTCLIGAGGFLIGRWWQRRQATAAAEQSQGQVRQILDDILAKLAVEDDLAKKLDPVACGGRRALDRVLTGLRDFGGYAAVVLSDEAGLVIAMCGAEEQSEVIAVEAATFGAASERVRDGRQTILHTLPEKEWTLHRYFQVDGSLLCLSASRRGRTPRSDALDGAMGAIQRVLGSSADVAA